jgi:hypothetical protein
MKNPSTSWCTFISFSWTLEEKLFFLFFDESIEIQTTQIQQSWFEISLGKSMRSYLKGN